MSSPKSLNHADIKMMMTMLAPPQGMKDTICAALLLAGERYDQASDWKYCKKTLSNKDGPTFTKMKGLTAKDCSSEDVKKAKALLQPYTAEKCKNISAALPQLFHWAKTIVEESESASGS